MSKIRPERTVCPMCEGFAIRLCPWCKIDIKDEEGKVIQSKPGQGCRACSGKSIFSCTQCDGRGYLPVDEIEISRPRGMNDSHLPDY